MPSGGHNKLQYKEVKKIFEEKGFKLLATNYVSNNTPMRAICSCGSEIEIRLSHVQRGNKCQLCKAKTNSEKLRTSDATIIAFCKSKGCQFVQSWIQSKRIRIAYICKCGSKTEANWSNFTRCPNCKKCGSAKVSGANCYMYDPDRAAIALRKKFRKICGQHIRRFIKATGQKKTRHTHELLGYTPKQLQEHILNHPDYAGVKDGIWHVDHIFPLQAFFDHKIFDLKLINALNNLRPLAGPENLSKADKYDETEFMRWLTIQGGTY